MAGTFMTEKPIERKRVKLDLSPEAFVRLAEMKKMSHADSNTEVVRNALRLYEWFLEQKNENYKIQIAKGDEVKEIEFIF